MNDPTTMTLGELLQARGIDQRNVLVLRHRPHEPGLAKVLPWLAAEKPDVFNAYQQTQGERLESVMRRLCGESLIASFIGHAPGNAVFVGMFAIRGSTAMTFDEFWSVPAYREMREYGMRGWAREDRRSTIDWFDLVPTDQYAAWKGRLIVGWPPPERSWWRRAHRNRFPVEAVFEESTLDKAMPEWDAIDLAWSELSVLPTKWKTVLAQWRGIYYIFDTADGKGYVGSAYGASNILGRWQTYANNGDGGNRLLRPRDPRTFRFSILQRVSPDTEAADVIRCEATWKDRLHTRAPWGLNDN